MSRFTYAIGWRHQRDREDNLSKVLDWLRPLPDIDVLVVEQDNMKRFRPPPGVRHVFARSTEPYNRSWGFNIAYRESDSPHIVFGDSDIIMRSHEFLSAMENSLSLDVLSPYSSVLDLFRDENSMSLDDMVRISRPGRGELDNQKINLCGGVVIFSRDAFERVGGWDEGFVDWGGEDDMMTFKIEAAGLRTALLPYRCYHLWHGRIAPDPVAYSRTLRRLRSMIALGGSAVLDLALKNFSKCGDKEKFT